MLVENRTSIGKLRVASNDRDTLRVELELGHLLSSGDLHPRGLPASAIVCVKKFSAPQPASSYNELRTSNWQQAVRAALGSIAAAAVRPIEAVPSAGANAVIFADVAEMLACLARDWCDGSVHAYWWWRVLLKDQSSLWKIWSHEPEFIPTALAHLAKRGQLVEFVTALREDEARDLTHRVVQAFGLRELLPVIDQPIVRGPSAFEKGTEPSSWTPSADRGTQITSLPVAAPWRHFVPETQEKQLNSAAERFLGIALIIQRAPARARSTRFARAVQRWQQQLAEPSAIEPNSSAVPEIGGAPPASQPSSTRRQLHPQRPAPPAEQFVMDCEDASKRSEQLQSSTSTLVATDKPPVEHDSEFVESETKPKPVATSGAEETPRQRDHTNIDVFESDLQIAADSVADQIERELDVLSEPSVSAPHAEVAPEPEFVPEAFAADVPEWIEPSAARESDEFLDAIEIETGLGGLFYLVNLALYLNLYSDFTNPTGTGIELSIWDFIALIGTELTGDPAQDDPIWSLLTELAGRDQGDYAGIDFAPSDEWRIPAEWLSAFGSSEPARWSATGGRLRLLHPVGFLILDLPLGSGDPTAQINREIIPYKDRGTRILRVVHERATQTQGHESAAPLHIWLARLMPYVRARLRRALGQTESSTEDLARILLRCYGRVRVTATHLDLFFNLAELPIEIRLAGLDRDPGWVPAAGRFITFHYE